MKRHVKIYFDHHGYKPGDFIPCRVCGCTAVDIHHIIARRSGGNPSGDKDTPENLIALCRKHHEEFGDKKQYIEYLRSINK